MPVRVAIMQDISVLAFLRLGLKGSKPTSVSMEEADSRSRNVIPFKVGGESQGNGASSNHATLKGCDIQSEIVGIYA